MATIGTACRKSRRRLRESARTRRPLRRSESGRRLSEEPAVERSIWGLSEATASGVRGGYAKTDGVRRTPPVAGSGDKCRVFCSYSRPGYRPHQLLLLRC